MILSRVRDTVATSEEGCAPSGTEIVPGYEVVSLMRHGRRLDTYDAHSKERDCRCVLKVVREDRAHWSTILVSTFSDRASMHPGCHQVTALLA